MRYEEAKEKIEHIDKGYKTSVPEQTPLLYGVEKITNIVRFEVSYNTIPILSVGLDIQYDMRRYVDSGDLSKLPAFDKVFKIVSELSATPLIDRISHKYYVKIKGLPSELGYLNYGNDFLHGQNNTEEYTIRTKKQTNIFKTTFTKSEIKKLVDNKDFFLQEDSFELEPVDTSSTGRVEFRP